MMMNTMTMMMMKMLTMHQQHHPSDKMITRTKATTSKTTHKARTRRQKPTIEQKRSFTLLTLSLGAIVCVFSSVLSSLLSDRIRFRIGKIASLSTLINPSSSFLGARKSELRREKQTQRKSSSRTRRREMFESVKEIVESYLLVLS